MIFRAAFLVAAVALLAGCDDGLTEPEPDGGGTPSTVAAFVADNDDLTTLASALETTSLGDLLGGGGPFTLFAPNDEAFFLLGEQSAGALLDTDNVSLLTEVLRTHVVPERLDAETLDARAAAGGTVSTLAGVEHAVTRADNGALLIGGVEVVATDQEAGNGVVHTLVGVLLTSLDTAERLRVIPYSGTFEQALGTAGLLGTLTGEPVTVLVPLNDGFARQPGGRAAFLNALADASNATLAERVLRYHLLPGRRALAELLADGTAASLDGATLDFRREGGLSYVNAARVLASDIETANGLLHVIEGPLYEQLTILERLRLIPDATRARTALASTGLDATLEGEGPFTLFLPTDGAFTLLGTDVYIPLLADQQADLLPTLLGHHVSPETIVVEDLTQGAEFPALDGGPINVRRDSETNEVLVDGARLSRFTDLRAANGTLHLMREVLIPDVVLLDRMFLAGYTRFLDLIEIAGLTEELRTGGPYTIVAPRVVSSFYFTPSNACHAENAVYSHIGDGRVYSNPLGFGFATLAGGSLSIDNGVASHTLGSLGTATAPVLDLDLDATNGVVHGVDNWLSLFPDPPGCN